MFISMNFDSKNLANKRPLKLHYLPAKIDGNGECGNVEKYFNNYTRESPNCGAGILTNSLRGYPLIGSSNAVPFGHKGVVLQETDPHLEQRQLRLTGTFEEITYWNYDKVPSKGDSYQHALTILKVANALTDPVTEEQMEEERIRVQQDKKDKT